MLADHRLTIYGAGRRVVVQDDAARRAFVESRYALIEETATAGGLDTLAAAYTAARDGAAAARTGGTDLAAVGHGYSAARRVSGVSRIVWR